MYGLIIRDHVSVVLEVAWPSADGRLHLTGANLAGADLAGADLAEASLFEADLTRANLAWANLTRANLIEANLAGANLTRANLAGANLFGADLFGADLFGADLFGANLAGANLTRANLPDHWTVRQWSGCGSGRRQTTLAIWPGGHQVWCGCFSGTVADFAAAVEHTHANNQRHLDDYREIVASMLRLLAREHGGGDGKQLGRKVSDDSVYRLLPLRSALSLYVAKTARS